MLNDKLEVPDDFLESDVHVAIRGLVMARGPNGEQIPAFIAVRGKLIGQTQSSLIVHTSQESILGPIGDHAIPKETIQGCCKMGSIAVTSRLSLTCSPETALISKFSEVMAARRR